MNDYPKSKQVIDDFWKEIIRQSRANLTRAGKRGQLYQSLDYEVESNLSSKFIMEDYGEFVDEGVKGKDPSKVSPNAKITGQQAPNSRFKFGSGTSRGKWSSFIKSLTAWVARKRIRLRDDKGKFTKGNFETIAQIIGGNIYNRGIKPSLFFTKPFNKNFPGFVLELEEAFAQDTEDNIGTNGSTNN